MKSIKAFQLSVPKPCSEDWNQMTPKEQGRHCMSCAKVVTDFTKMSDAELIDFLQSGKGSGCGRFHQHQLQRTMLPQPESHLWSFPRFLAASAISFFMAIGSALGQSVTGEIMHIEQHDTADITQPAISDTLVLKGNVTDGNEPVPFVNVLVVEANLGVFTDFDGNFRIEIPQELYRDEYTLQFSSFGYEVKEMVVASSHGETAVELDVDLETEAVIMGMHVIIVQDPPMINGTGERVYDSRLKSNPRY